MYLRMYFTIFLTMSVYACGKARNNSPKASHKNHEIPNTEPVLSPENENTEISKKEESPSSEANPSQTESNQNQTMHAKLSISNELSQKLSMKEIKVELEGDFKIKKVLTDSENNFVLGIVCDSLKSKHSGFMLLKISPKGEELWRFPTKSSYRLEKNPSTEGSYFIGELVDFDLNYKSQIAVIGIKQRMSNLKLAKEYSFANVVQNRIPHSTQIFEEQEITSIHGNETFYWLLESPNNQEKNLKVIYKHILASPTWWEPVGISFDSKNNIRLSSSSGNEVNDPLPPNEVNNSYVMQEQIFSEDLKSVIQSVCYLSKGQMAPVGKIRLNILQSSAPKWLVERMTTPVTQHLHNDPPWVSKTKEEVEGYSWGVYLRNRARCWDVLRNEVMTDGPFTKIHRPIMHEASEKSSFELSSVDDLFLDEDKYRKHSVEDPFIHNSFQIWGQSYSNWGQNMEFTKPMVKLHDLEDDIVYLGFSSPDIFGNSHLIASNLKTFSKEKWQVELNSNRTRSPSSISLTSMVTDSLTKNLYAAWTEQRIDGEHLAGSRRLRLTKISIKESLPILEDLYELDAPEDQGYNNYTSTRVIVTSQKSLAFFATASRYLKEKLSRSHPTKKIETLNSSSLWFSHSALL